jgi:hypothetical protein
MSNTAPGFAHLTFNTTAPVISGIGTFEWQLISGRLKGSGILPADTGRTFNGQTLYVPKPDDDRYLNGMIITWQPKWTKGLHLGFSRVFNQYYDDVASSFDGYLPVLGAFFKGKTTNEDQKKRDQMLSVFLRMVLPKEKAEVYVEFARNDHSQNSRDLLLAPGHASGFIIGGRKIFETQKNKRNFELGIEVMNLQQSLSSQVREEPAWYEHHQVVHGYTNRGQIIGAGIGPASNSQTINLNWIKGINNFGVTLERVEWNSEFYYNAFSSSRNFGSQWVDASINVHKNWLSKRFMYTANLTFIRSLNYQWRHEFDTDGNSINRDVSNLSAAFSVSYLF